MAQNKTFNVNDTVFYFDPWGVLREAVVTEVLEEKDEPWVRTKIKGGGSAGAKMSVCYATQEECIAAENERRTKQVALYKASITDVKSLVAFCLDHNVSGDPEYGSEDARTAARERAKELLDIETDY